MKTYQERKAAAIREAIDEEATGGRVAAETRVISIYDGTTEARVVEGPDGHDFYVVEIDDGPRGTLADWRRDEFTLAARPLDRILGIERTVVHTRTSEPESAQAHWQRTDPVGYQECRDAGRI